MGQVIPFGETTPRRFAPAHLHAGRLEGAGWGEGGKGWELRGSLARWEDGAAKQRKCSLREKAAGVGVGDLV